MTRCVRTVLFTAVVGLFLSTFCLRQSEPATGSQTVFSPLNDLQIAKINELIDTKLKTFGDSQAEKVNEMIDAKLKTLSDLQTEKVNDLIDAKIGTFSDSQAARVNDLIDAKLGPLNGSQAMAGERDAIVLNLLTLNRKIDDIRRRQLRQREYIVEPEDECACRGDLR
jgi:hypothetical protein